MNDESFTTGTDIAQVLGVERPGRARRARVLFSVAVLLAVALVSAWVVFRSGDDTPVVQFETLEATRGALTVHVIATGTLEPLNQVDVGTEISGTIERVDADYNQRVKRGEILAKLNTDRLEAQVIQARASLETAKAKLREAQATVEETRLRWERCAKLARKEMCSREELESAKAAYARAQAGEASADAQIAVAQATLDAQETDLGKAVIRAPIDGIVLKREIEPGQTVAASLQTPVLFVLAENLSQMELRVAVDEADVGMVSEGQDATFTVDAYPNRRFSAAIQQVRFAPETVDGVVSYETVLSVDNGDLLLRPGMTATAEITVRHLEDVLLVPNAALRFAPPAAAAAPRRRPGVFGWLFQRPARDRTPNAHSSKETAPGQQRVWTIENGVPRAVTLTVGVSDGLVSEVVSGELAPGTPLLVDVASPRR